MKKTIRTFAVFALLLASAKTIAQNAAINSTGTAPDASAMLDVSSTTKGLLTPRMTAAQRTAIASPATGLIVYQTDGTDGFYYYDGSSWILLINNADALPAVSGAAVTDLNASNLASGTVPTARLGSGTADATTYLRGDGAWSAVAASNLPCSSISANTTLSTASQFVYITGNYEVKLPASPATGQMVFLYTDNTSATVNPNGKSFRQANADWGTSPFSDFGNAASYGLILFYNGTKWFPMSWN